jgi:hypothetical protein
MDMLSSLMPCNDQWIQSGIWNIIKQDNRGDSRVNVIAYIQQASLECYEQNKTIRFT